MPHNFFILVLYHVISNLPDNLKRNFLRAAVETVFFYGSVSWTLTTHLEKKIDGAYTRMLRTALNRSWKDHPTNVELYGHIPPISESLQQQRMRFAGHCWHGEEELARDVLLWKPTHRLQPKGRPKKTYMRVMEYRASSTWWWWWMMMMIGREGWVKCETGQV